MWLWSTDRDQTKDITGVHRSYLGEYAPPPCWWHMHIMCQSYDCHMTGRNVSYARPHRRICPQCLLRTGQFNKYQSRAKIQGLTRHLDDMLALPDAQRQAHSFLCAGPGFLHGPLAIATVDPAVLRLDMHCAPPDRWHGVVDMIDDLTGAVRVGLKHRKQAGVCTRARQGAAVTN